MLRTVHRQSTMWRLRAPPCGGGVYSCRRWSYPTCRSWSTAIGTSCWPPTTVFILPPSTAGLPGCGPRLLSCQDMPGNNGQDQREPSTFCGLPRTPSHAHTLLSASPVDSSRLAPSTRRASASSPARGALPCRGGLPRWHMCCTDALPAAPRCQRAFRQKANEMKTTAGSDAQGTDQGCSAGLGASSLGPVSPVSPDQVACPPPRSISRLALDEDGGRSSMDDDSGQSSPSADGRSLRRGWGRPAACPPPPAAAPSAATEEQLKGLFGRLRSHMLAHSPHLAMLAMSIVPPESPDQDAQ